VKLSPESRKFIEDLRLYLFSTGKSDEEIEDIVAELEDHLWEAEKRGKPIIDIIGNSPKEYMEQFANEMKFDIRKWTGYGAIMILGVFAFVLMGDVINQDTDYSWYELIGYPLLTVCFLLLLMKTMKFLAGARNKSVGWIVLLLISAIQIGGFVVLILLDNRYGETVIHFNSTGNIVLFCLSALIFIVCSIWSKSLVLIIIPIFLYLPEYVLTFTSLNEGLQMFISHLISILGIVIYLFFINRKENRFE
jgi:hypothetical protein